MHRDTTSGSLVEAVSSLFSEVLPATVPSFEERQQQRAMAAAVAHALETSEHLIIEAPTGVGKSLAYLLPTVLAARRSERQAIISTNTRTLQDQLLAKDLPLVRAALDIPFEATTLKGRRNYLCPTRLANALASQAALFDDQGERELAAIAAWAATTRDGDLDHLHQPLRSDVWEMVCSERGICSPSRCGTRCFYRRALERARRADLVIMNHALYFALTAADEGEDDPAAEGGFVIFDEAHTLESVASNGKRVSRTGLLHQLHHLYHPRQRRGVLARTRPGGRTALTQALRDVNAFWESIRAHALAHRPAQRTGETLLVRLHQPLRESLEPTFTGIQELLLRMRETTDDPSLQTELTLARRTLQETELTLREILGCADQGMTYWLEYQARPRSSIALCSAPVDVCQTMRERVFRDGTPVVLTSASLAVGGNLDYFAARIGGATARTLVLDTPFAYQRQMTVALPRGCPEPDDPRYGGELPRWILAAIRESGGRALVLFTNAATMQTVAEALAPALADLGIALLVQGPATLREALLDEFRRDVTSTLFGLDSFWFGVDVPGEALEHVIIVRLPFPVPGHPLIEARMEALQLKGGHPFLQYMLPEAVLKLRQGVGRLIRSSSDRGRVTILDSRILNKSYGRVFLESLPRCPVELWSPEGDAIEVDRGDW